MNHRVLVFVLSGSALAIAATTACGSASNSSLFGAGGGVQGTGGTAPHGGSGSGARGGSGAGGSGAGGSGAGGTRGSGGSGVGGSGVGGSGVGGSGVGGTAGTGGSGIGGTGGFGTGGFGTGGFGTGGFGTGGSGTGGSSGNAGIACGSSTCNAGTDFCCDFTNKAPACNPIGTQCYPSTDLYCDGPEDCPSGQVCCGQIVRLQNGQYMYNEVRCSSTCDYAQNQRVFCHDTSQCTASGQTCQQSQTLPAYTVCGY